MDDGLIGTTKTQKSLEKLFEEIRRCELCKDQLPKGPKPIIRGSKTSRLLIIGQAPGVRVHNSGIPFNDPSGDRLRSWLGLSKDTFYNEDLVAIMPMGLCYPGTGQRGDLPPQKECAPQWHKQVLNHLPERQLTLLVGSYAQKYYLKPHYKNMTAALRQWQEAINNKTSGLDTTQLNTINKTIYDQESIMRVPMPHPSPRNNLWLKNHPWFEEEILPSIRQEVRKVLD